MRFAVRGLALLGAGTLLAASPGPVDPLAAVAAANGHAARVHVRAAAHGTIEGRRVDLTVEQLGTTRLVRRCVADVCAGSWFDGTRRWTFGLNEVLLPDDDDPLLSQRRTLAAIVSYAFAEPAFRAAGGTVSAAGPNAWNVRAAGGAPLTASLDPASQALRRVSDASGQTVAVYDGERRAGGATFALRENGPEGFTLDEAVAVAGPLPPPPGVSVTFSGDGRLPLGADPVPIVPCSIGGRAVRCLIDTGATPSAISLPLADLLGLEPRGEIDIAAFGRFVTGFVEAGPLEVGAARFERVRLAVISQTSAARFDAIVGADLLGRLRVVLDRGRNLAVVTAAAPPGAAGTAGATTVPLVFQGGVPRVQAALAGAAAQSALLDTGDQAVVSFGYAEYRRGPQWPIVDRMQVGGVGGTDDAFAVTVPDVRVGTLVLGPSRAVVRRTQATPHVGIGLWARFVVDLDEAAATVVIRPR